MSHGTDPLPQGMAFAAGSPATLERLERALAAHWDPDGDLARALAARPDGPDPTRPRSLAEVARDVAGLLAAGATEADVGGYLRREERAVLPGDPTPDELALRHLRRDRVRAALWRVVRGIARADDLASGIMDDVAERGED